MPKLSQIGLFLLSYIVIRLIILAGAILIKVYVPSYWIDVNVYIQHILYIILPIILYYSIKKLWKDLAFRVGLITMVWISIIVIGVTAFAFKDAGFDVYQLF